MWFYQYQGREVGPLTLSEILQRFRAGGLETATMVRQSESAEWLPLEHLLAQQPVEAAAASTPASFTAKIVGANQPFVSLRSLTHAMAILMLLGVTLSLFAFVLKLLDRSRLQGLIAQNVAYVASASGEPSALQVASAFVTMLQFLASVFVLMVACRWIFQAAHNVRALGAQGLTISPGWSVGWFFVPFANLWMPYRAMRQIARASVDVTSWQSVQPTALMPIWWVLWVGSNVWQHFCARAQIAAQSYVAELEANGCNLTLTPASIALNLVFAGMLWQIYVAQERQALAKLNRPTVSLDKAN